MSGMERLPFDLQQRGVGGWAFMFASLVEGIADDRPVARGQMDADLVCASGEQMAGEQACDFVIGIAESLTQTKFGDGRFAAMLAHGHFAPMDRMASDGRVDAFGPGRRPAPHEGQIFAADFIIFAFLAACGELFGEAMMCQIGFRRDDQTACVHVEPMDDARALLASDAGEAAAAMMQQRIDERIVVMACARMNWQSGGFVDDDEVVIFVEDIEVDRAGFNGGRFAWRDGDHENITFVDFGAGIIEGLVVPPDMAGFDQGGCPHAADALIGQRGRQSAGEKEIGALALIFLLSGDLYILSRSHRSHKREVICFVEICPKETAAFGCGALADFCADRAENLCYHYGSRYGWRFVFCFGRYYKEIVMSRLASVPWIILLVLGASSFARGVLHYFAPDSGAGIIAGMDLSPANGADIIFLLGAAGSMQMALGAFFIWIALKARALVPVALWIEGIRTVLFVTMEFTFKMPANPVPGRYVHVSMMILALVALAVHLWLQRQQQSAHPVASRAS